MGTVKYVLDTVALARYLEGNVPETVDKIFNDAEEGNAKIIIPHIVIGEFIYIALKGRLRVDDPEETIIELLNKINDSDIFEIRDMEIADWHTFLDIKIPEMHDRMIAAIAKNLNAPVITTDEEISKSRVVDVVW